MNGYKLLRVFGVTVVLGLSGLSLTLLGQPAQAAPLYFSEYGQHDLD